MTVSELIQQLQACDPNMKVHFSYNCGDYWRTTVTPTVDRVEEAAVKFSDYHRMHKLVDDRDEEVTESVVVIS
jgi:hypothetical protein